MVNLKIFFIFLFILFGKILISAGGEGIFSNLAIKQDVFGSARHTAQTTKFLTYNGQRVRLDIYHPGTINPPAAILIHGAAGIEGDRALRYQRFATDLVNKGIAAINVHYFNTAQQYWIQTIEETVNYLSNTPNINANRIALIGYSLGGTLAISAAVRSEKVKVLVINSGSLPQNFSQKDVANLPQDIYMSCGTEDFCYPCLQQLDRMTRGANKSFIKRTREGGGHTMPLNVFWQQWQEIVDFVADKL